jgi:hypothetical protein
MSLHVAQEYDNPTAFHGRASYSASDGQIEGTLNGAQLSMQIYWKNGDLALYEGKINPRGMIEGTAYVKGHEGRRISWFSSRPMTWSPWPGDVTIPGVGTFPKGAPIITANPSAVSIPAGKTEAESLLSWDGGKNHPYAEVWVKVGDLDEVFVLESGKGRRQIKIEKGKSYLYILTDSGKRLATVTVKSK